MAEHTETAQVVEILNGGSARVLLRRKKWCDHCASRNFCNPPAEEEKEFFVEVDNPLGAQNGDLVEIGLERGALLFASFWAYLVPSLLFIAGMAIGFLALSRAIVLIPREIIGFLTGILFLAASFVLLRIVNRRFGKKEIFRPRITAICSGNSHSE
jgi:sigma-E factor negative regulatory protein RseC